jgi:cyclic-di-GMP phosphodiesterase TipF (flagellum assembly factor)
MLRVSAIFVVICMVLIAGASGAVLYMAFGLSGSESTIVGVAVLTALALYNAVTTRLRDRTDVSDQITDLSRGSADMARQLAEFGRRLATIEGQGSSAAETARAAVAPISAELGEIGTLVKQLAESVAAHDAALAAGAIRPVNVAGPAPAPSAEPANASRPAVSEVKPAAAAPAPPAGHSEDILAAIRSAIEAHRIDMHLQPIVTLPQRKVRYYEALSRLRTEDGHMLPPAEFLQPAEASGLLGRIDHLLLFRCIQVVRRLLLKNRDIGLFCNISATTLNDPQYFPEMAQFMEANRALAPSIVLEFKQSAWNDMGPLELEGLAALRELGFRFCMDQVTELRMDPRDLAERGVRFVKVPASLLLARAETSAFDIHAADLSNLLHRHGISLIADKIEAENQVVELLDYDLTFGQGFLFSPPRPVRAEALQGVVERAEPAKRDEGGEPRAAAV